MKKFFQLSFCMLAFQGLSIYCEEKSLDDLLNRAAESYQQEKYSDAFQDFQKASLMAFEKMDLTLDNFFFIEEPSEGYGIYKERGSSTYKSGEPIYIYCEPIGYTFAKTDGLYSFGLTTDFYVTDEEGNNLGGQDRFGVFSFDSHQPSMEFMLNLTYSLSGLKKGIYTIHTIAKDPHSKKETKKSINVQIEEDEE